MKTDREARKWQRQIERDFDFAKGILLSTGQVLPCFVVHSPDRSAMLGVPMDTDERKDDIAQLVKLFALAHDAEAISFISEAWTRNVPRLPGESDREHQKRAVAVRASEAEDRREVVVVQITWRDSDDEMHAIHCGGEIERDADGKPSGLINETNSTLDGTDLVGRFSSLVPPFRLSPAQRAKAAELLPELVRYLGLGMQVIDPSRMGHA